MKKARYKQLVIQLQKLLEFQRFVLTGDYSEVMEKEEYWKLHDSVVQCRLDLESTIEKLEKELGLEYK